MIKNKHSKVTFKDKNSYYTILYFSATWCGACKQMKKVWADNGVQEYIQKQQRLTFQNIDADKSQDWCKGWKVNALPTTIIVTYTNKKWVELKRIVGAVKPKELISFLSSTFTKYGFTA